MVSYFLKKNKFYFVLIFFIILNIHKSFCDVQISNKDFEIERDDKYVVNINIQNYNGPSEVTLSVQHEDIIKISPSNFKINKGDNLNFSIEVNGIGAGHSDVFVNDTQNYTDLKDIYFKVTVEKSAALDKFSLAIGWIYFVAWSVSFYPQIYENWKRKSVVGLNFDFVALNVVGFFLYSVFNIGLYASSGVQEQYFARFPRGLNPVKINDIVFGVHAFAATIITIGQCFIYEKSNQRISTTAKSIIGIFFVFLFISLCLAWGSVILALDFITYCSYVKLTISLIKYIPQAYMNYKRQSTQGWSIGNILLDFTGGILSMLQMIINAYNFDDWVSLFGDPTKFGLGFFSVIFDIFFIIQHYFLYRRSNYDETP